VHPRHAQNLSRAALPHHVQNSLRLDALAPGLENIRRIAAGMHVVGDRRCVPVDLDAAPDAVLSPRGDRLVELLGVEHLQEQPHGIPPRFVVHDRHRLAGVEDLIHPERLDRRHRLASLDVAECRRRRPILPQLVDLIVESLEILARVRIRRGGHRGDSRPHDVPSICALGAGGGPVVADHLAAASQQQRQAAADRRLGRGVPRVPLLVDAAAFAPGVRAARLISRAPGSVQAGVGPQHFPGGRPPHRPAGEHRRDRHVENVFHTFMRSVPGTPRRPCVCRRRPPC